MNKFSGNKAWVRNQHSSKNNIKYLALVARPKTITAPNHIELALNPWPFGNTNVLFSSKSWKTFFFISKEVYKKCKDAPKYTGSIQKGHQNKKKEEREEKTPLKPKNRRTQTPQQTSPQNPETITSH
jgi:hypothetical protein